MKRLCWFLFVVFALITYACKSELKIYRIGAVIPLSGDAEAYGQAVKSGVTLALEEINQLGGIKGKQLDILIEDSQSDEKKAIDKVNQLIKGGSVPLIIGGITSSEALSVAPVCESSKIVCLSPSASSPKLSGAGQYFFRNYPSDTLEGRVMAEYAVRRMKIRSVAIVYQDNEYGQSLMNVFKERFQELQGEIKFEKGYAEGTSDFAGTIKEIKANPPDAVYLPGYFTEVASVLKEIQAQKLSVKVISSGGMASPRILDMAGDAAEGVVFPQPPYDAKSADANVQRFVSSYKKKFYAEPDVYAAYAYDAVKIIAKAIDNCADYPVDLRERMADVSGFMGITGEIAFDANGDVDVTPLMMEVKGGQFTKIE